MARKTLPDVTKVANTLVDMLEQFSELTEQVKALTDAAAPIRSELADGMREKLVMIARDATDAAVRLNATIRSARLRESLPTDPSGVVRS